MNHLIFILKEKTRKLFSRIGSDSRKDWNILIITMLVLLIALFVYHISLFFSSYIETSYGPSLERSSIKILNREGLTKALKSLELKKTSYSNYISNPPAFRDPSF